MRKKTTTELNGSGDNNSEIRWYFTILSCYSAKIDFHLQNSDQHRKPGGLVLSNRNEDTDTDTDERINEMNIFMPHKFNVN